MHRTRLWVLLCLTGIGQVSLFGCGDDEGTSRPAAPSAGGDGSTLGGEGPDQSLGGNATTNPSGGSSSGTTAATGGADPGVTPMAGAGQGGVFGAGGATEPTLGEQLKLCARLSGLTTHAFNVEQTYVKAAFNDCRVSWVIPRGDDLVPFKNELVVWNLELWGCQGKPVDTFALVFGTPGISEGDATILVDTYMTAADDELDLSSPEFTEMKAALERLAHPLVTSSSSAAVM